MHCNKRVIHVPWILAYFGRWSKDFSYLTIHSNMWYDNDTIIYKACQHKNEINYIIDICVKKESNYG